MEDVCAGRTFYDLWIETVRSRSEHMFLIFEDRNGDRREYSYASFHKLVCRTANLLAAQGVKRGDQVGIHLHDCPEYLMVLFATIWIGGIAVPINADSRPLECARTLSCCDLRLVITDNQKLFLESMPSDSAPLTRILRCSCIGYSESTLDSPFHMALEQCDDIFVVPESVSCDDVCEILFTSGTTSCPKGVAITQANLVISGYYGAWQASIRSESRLTTPIHAMHIYFQTEALFPVVAAGATLVYLQKYSARRFWRQCCFHRSTHAQGMATIALTMLAQTPEPWEREHPPIEFIYFLPISTEEKERFENRFNVTILNAYGATETINAAIGDLPLGKRNWPSIGRPGLGYEALVVDEAGMPLGPGMTGELWIHGEPGRTLMKGYWRNDEATRAVLTEDGWFKTGDLGYVSEDGWFYYVGRKKEMMKIKGENVSPAEIEEVLREVDGVSEAAVIGISDKFNGCAPIAFVIMEEGQVFDELKLVECCRRYLADFKIPKRIYPRDEFPRSTYGKVSKSRLAESIK